MCYEVFLTHSLLEHSQIRGKNHSGEDHYSFFVFNFKKLPDCKGLGCGSNGKAPA
jgi:hypothetical protein